MKPLWFSALIVLVLSYLYRNQKHLVLKIPKYGFVIFNSLGGALPGFMDFSILEYESEWGRDGDVFCLGAGKSGTTWMSAVLHYIRSHGKPAPFKDIFLEVPWIEFVYYPGQTMKERIEIIEKNRSLHPFAILRSHRAPKILRETAKYVVTVRSPIDSSASIRTFLINHEPSFSKMWGGFPPQAGYEEECEEQFEKMLFGPYGPGKIGIDVFFFDFIKQMWSFRKRPNVFIVNYQTRVSSKGDVANIAKFLGINLTQSEIELIENATSFKTMKSQPHLYDLSHVFDELKERNLVDEDVRFLKKGSMIALGPSRNGTRELSPKLVARITNYTYQQFGPQIAKYLLEGGEIPDIDIPVI